MFDAHELLSGSIAIACEPISIRRNARCFTWLAAIWHRYRRAQECSKQRRALLELDDHLLGDIGISRESAKREADKPFLVLTLSGRC